MVISLYETKLTRDIRHGEKNPERNMLNRKAMEKGSRRDRWLKNKHKEKG